VHHFLARRHQPNCSHPLQACMREMDPALAVSSVDEMVKSEQPMPTKREANGMGLYTPPTFIVPEIPHPAAITSPQYRSLHHEMHQPPSASLFPTPPLPWSGGCDCCNAWATRDAEAPSSVAPVCVGVENVTEWEEGRDAVGSEVASTSSDSCQVASDDCSKHSYIRR